VQSSSQIVTTNKPTPSFYGPDAIPIAQPTASEYGLAQPSSSRVVGGRFFQRYLLQLKARGYLEGRVAKPLVSPLTPVLRSETSGKYKCYCSYNMLLNCGKKLIALVDTCSSC